MNNHVSQWLNAYHDDELRPRRRALVEAHLEECQQCQAELEELQALSAVLQEDPLPEMRTSPEQFAAQVALRLPRHGEPARRQNGSNFRWLWYALPVGILVAVGFLRTIVSVSEVLMWVERLGINPGLVSWLMPVSERPPTLIAEFSELVVWWNNPFQSPLALTVILPVILGFCYLVWMLVWWADQQTQNSMEGESARQ